MWAVTDDYFPKKTGITMNILPKKSWHVLSRDNIQRVRRDEAAAKAQEEELQRRADLAEKEARLAHMRKQARERDGIEGFSAEHHSSTNAGADESRHSNLFADIQHGIGVQSLKNKEHESEEKKEQEKFEKKVGILNYLVDKDKSDDPWYVKGRNIEEASARTKKRTELQDPLIKMNEFLDKKRKIEERTSDKTRLPGASASMPTKSSQDDRHHRKKHKHKSKKSSSDIEKLRRERKRREEAERMKTEELLRKYHGLPSEAESSTIAATPEKKYNSQFNPHLARH